MNDRTIPLIAISAAALIMLPFVSHPPTEAQGFVGFLIAMTIGAGLFVFSKRTPRA